MKKKIWINCHISFININYKNNYDKWLYQELKFLVGVSGMLSLQELDADSSHFSRSFDDASAPVKHGRMGEVADKGKELVWHKQGGEVG